MFEKWLSGLEPVYRAETDAEREEIYRLRYQVYVDELGKQVVGADHARRRIHDPQDDAPGTQLFYTGNPRNMTGTCRLEIWQPGQVPEERWRLFNMDAFPGMENLVTCECGRLMVTRSARGKLILAAIARALYEVVCAAGADFNFAYCSPGLVRSYRRLGYRPYACDLVAGEDGLRVPVVMVTSDLAFYKRVHSPLTPFVRDYFGNGKRPFPDLTPFRDVLNEDAVPFETDPSHVWREMQEDLLNGHAAISPFLAAIPHKSVKKLSEKGFVMDVPANRVITRENLMEREIFVALEGTFEVLVGGRRINIMHRGDVFGEVAFFHEDGRRTASIHSLTAGQLLVLRRKFIEELMEDDPAIAAQLLLNLSRVMARRLANMTQQHH